MIVLVETNADKMNYERAIFWSEEIKDKIGVNDSRYRTIQKQVSDFKAKQIIEPKKE